MKKKMPKHIMVKYKNSKHKEQILKMSRVK